MLRSLNKKIDNLILNKLVEIPYIQFIKNFFLNYISHYLVLKDEENIFANFLTFWFLCLIYPFISFLVEKLFYTIVYIIDYLFLIFKSKKNKGEKSDA
ncbi:hypothetical protein MDPP_00199 [Candidatus Phytoplasma pini]|uniref:Uncharacterized protein n=1 Tax=Candidatus Phytoplasma pini TaxID=267362 RepID=A0A559KJE0_9MOLU|nr:hypothetical protein MDPP_00199 [Candidatus Phytoplasma pini]